MCFYGYKPGIHAVSTGHSACHDTALRREHRLVAWWPREQQASKQASNQRNRERERGYGGTGGHRSRYVREFTGRARIVNLRHGRNCGRSERGFRGGNTRETCGSNDKSRSRHPSLPLNSALIILRDEARGAMSLLSEPSPPASVYSCALDVTYVGTREYPCVVSSVRARDSTIYAGYASVIAFILNMLLVLEDL